ncbi:hypothetical protein V8E53_013498 [Lactarius tabidus]
MAVHIKEYLLSYDVFLLWDMKWKVTKGGYHTSVQEIVHIQHDKQVLVGLSCEFRKGGKCSPDSFPEVIPDAPQWNIGVGEGLDTKTNGDVLVGGVYDLVVGEGASERDHTREVGGHAGRGMGATGVGVDAQTMGELEPAMGNKGDGENGWEGGGDNGRGAGDG